MPKKVGSVGGPTPPPVPEPAQANAPKDEVQAMLKKGDEQQRVVGPLARLLLASDWEMGQMVFGKKEWRVPKSPSEAHKRERGESYEGFPCDIVLFDSAQRSGDPKHLVIIVECKQPDEDKGVAQLEQYMANEPHAQLGVWANNADPSAKAVFVYRLPSGKLLRKRKLINDFPRPGEKISPKEQRLHFTDLTPPSEEALKRTLEHLLDRVVIIDPNVTRREEQLDQLCNLLLLKLESDKKAKANATLPMFVPLNTPTKTGDEIRKHFKSFVNVYPEVFTEERDKKLMLANDTINMVVEELSEYKLIDLGVQTVSLGFQVLRAAALKQEEGQYFTPQPVIEAGVKLLKLKWEDIILDPACGTGGFLVHSMLDMGRRIKDKDELSRWAQTHLFGIDKDKIGVKLTKAVLQIAGDGSAHCVRGDSVLTHKWQESFPHLLGTFDNGRFSVVVTNPPFGNNLKISAEDSRLSNLDIAKAGGDHYEDMEIGLLFVKRAYDLLQPGGRLGIVLPETYFFSTNYKFLFDWMKGKFRPLVVANIPMEAFQGFCRAKTNFYVFQKLAKKS